MNTLNTQTSLLLELLTEELPPKALNSLGHHFSNGIFNSLLQQGLCVINQNASDTYLISFATPRRLAVLIQQVASISEDKTVLQKIMPIKVGLTADGLATPALIKKLLSLNLSEFLNPELIQAHLHQLQHKDGTLWLNTIIKGISLKDALQTALTQTLANLPIPKVMQYQLHENCELPGFDTVSFVRPAHRLLALHGTEIVPIQALGLSADRITQGHRFESQQATIILNHADDYETVLITQGAVIPQFEKRKQSIVAQLNQEAHALSQRLNLTTPLTPIQDEALLNEVTALVERPKVVLCQFDESFLNVPQECLILTMKANQKYFPLLNEATGQLSHYFLVVSNISPDDVSFIVEGNERVVRPRLADAQFFFNQDCKKSLLSRIQGLNKVVYHNQLGTQGDRTHRVVKISEIISNIYLNTLNLVDNNNLINTVKRSALLAKADLLTDMVGEFPELQGTMGRYYAINDGEPNEVAIAIEDHYKPRFSGDSLPRNIEGLIVALADKLETLIGLFGIGALPTGDKDPFALRRHAIGVYRILCELNFNHHVSTVFNIMPALFEGFVNPDIMALNLKQLHAFMLERITHYETERYSVHQINAVLHLNPDTLILSKIPAYLLAIEQLGALPEAPALAAANKRVNNILKKITGILPTEINLNLLIEPAEKHLFETLNTLTPIIKEALTNENYVISLTALATLKQPIDAFFETVMVNVEDVDLKNNRLALLNQLSQLMNQIADLSQLSN